MQPELNATVAWMRGKIILTVITVLVSLTFAMESGTAYANSLSSHSTPVATGTTVGLKIDCPRLPASVLKKAQQQGLCTKQSSAVSPYNIRTGDCGSSSLFITDNGNGGYPTITIGAVSSRGYMISIDWHVKWINYTVNTENGYGGSQGFFGDNWSHSDNPFTGVGWIYAVLDSLTVVTAEGYICYGRQPSDAAGVG